MQQSDVVPIHQGGDIMEAVITKGDLAKLTPQERVLYYKKVCDSVGLNPLTRPLAYITLNGKVVLYALRDAADQLRKINSISVEVVSQKVDGDMLTVHVRARDKSGRSDEDFGVVSIAGLRGEARANATLKCITKAKRRVTLSIAGLGFLDETEVDDIPARERVDTTVDTTTDLDQFAAVTGDAEPIPELDLLGEARNMAERGVTRFTRFWQTLTMAERDSIRTHLAEFETAARRADSPFDLPPLPSDRTLPEQRQDETAMPQPDAGPAPGPFPSDAGQPIAAGDVFSQLDHEARAATIEGVAAFAAWWKTLRRSDADLIRALKPEYEKLAADADARQGLAL